MPDKTTVKQRGNSGNLRPSKKDSLETQTADLKRLIRFPTYSARLVMKKAQQMGKVNWM